MRTNAATGHGHTGQPDGGGTDLDVTTGAASADCCTEADGVGDAAELSAIGIELMPASTNGGVATLGALVVLPVRAVEVAGATTWGAGATPAPAGGFWLGVDGPGTGAGVGVDVGEAARTVMVPVIIAWNEQW